ncbi:hypothetical protein SLS54_002181 [Diplodia seriata]
MSDKESDGPQKSHVEKADEQKPLESAHEEGDIVQMATGTNGKQEPYEVHKVQWNGKKWEYQLKRKGQKEVYSQMRGNKKVDWFPENELEFEG